MNPISINFIDDQSLYTKGGGASEAARPLEGDRGNRRDACRIGNARSVIQGRIISLITILIKS